MHRFFGGKVDAYDFFFDKLLGDRWLNVANSYETISRPVFLYLSIVYIHKIDKNKFTKMLSTVSWEKMLHYDSQD